MVPGKIAFEFTASVWQHASSGGWFFVSMPAGMASEIRMQLKWQEEGWGRIRARAETGSSCWDTAIWYDTKRKTYLLPIRSDIRKKENIREEMDIRVVVWV